MSGYATVGQVRIAVVARLVEEGRNPKGYNVSAIVRDAFYHRGGGYGYGTRPDEIWRAAVAKHRRQPTPSKYMTERKRAQRNGGTR